MKKTFILLCALTASGVQAHISKDAVVSAAQQHPKIAGASAGVVVGLVCVFKPLRTWLKAREQLRVIERQAVHERSAQELRVQRRHVQQAWNRMWKVAAFAVSAGFLTGAGVGGLIEWAMRKDDDTNPDTGTHSDNPVANMGGGTDQTVPTPIVPKNSAALPTTLEELLPDWDEVRKNMITSMQKVTAEARGICDGSGSVAQDCLAKCDAALKEYDDSALSSFGVDDRLNGLRAAVEMLKIARQGLQAYLENERVIEDHQKKEEEAKRYGVVRNYLNFVLSQRKDDQDVQRLLDVLNDPTKSLADKDKAQNEVWSSLIFRVTTPHSDMTDQLKQALQPIRSLIPYNSSPLLRWLNGRDTKLSCQRLQELLDALKKQFESDAVECKVVGDAAKYKVVEDAIGLLTLAKGALVDAVKDAHQKPV